MVIKVDTTGKTKSIYECDRCHKEINLSTDNRFKVIVRSKANNTLKTWDLCKRCSLLLCKGIEKGVKKDGNS